MVKELYFVGSSREDIKVFPEEVRLDIGYAVYAIKFPNAVYVLHCFQKKAKRGIKTPQQDIDLIKQRLKAAEESY